MFGKMILSSACALVATSIAFATSTTSKTAPAVATTTAAATASTGEGANIAEDMKVIATTYETLGKQITDKTKNASSLTMADTLIEKSNNAKSAKGEVPAAKAGKYEQDIESMLTHLNKMKTALQSGNNTEAKVHYDALKPWTTPSHVKKYK